MGGRVKIEGLERLGWKIKLHWELQATFFPSVPSDGAGFSFSVWEGNLGGKPGPVELWRVEQYTHTGTSKASFCLPSAKAERFPAGPSPVGSPALRSHERSAIRNSAPGKAHAAAYDVMGHDGLGYLW